MEEHRLRSQRSKHGGRDMISQHERISNRHLTQKQNELLRYFGNNVFKYILFVKVLYNCKELQIESVSSYLVITDSYCNRTR